MTRIEQIKLQVSELSPQELTHFRTWYLAFDADEWDSQMVKDADSVKLDKYAERALQAHAAGETRPL